MTENVTVKVLRLHTGDHGTKAEGETYETTRQVATQLEKRGIIEIAGKAEPAPANKAEAAPENKASGTPAVSTAPAPAAKPSQARKGH